MKRFLARTFAAAVMCAAVSGAVYAYPGDMTDGVADTFVRGTPDLKLGSGDGDAASFAVNGLMPGSSGTQTWTVTNAGSGDGRLTLMGIGVAEGAGATSEPELADESAGIDIPQLGNCLMAHLFVDTNGNGRWDEGEADILGTDAVPAAINTVAEGYDLGLVLGSGGTARITLTWQMPADAGNRIQGDTLSLDITFCLHSA